MIILTSSSSTDSQGRVKCTETNRGMTEEERRGGGLDMGEGGGGEERGKVHDPSSST